MWIERITIGKTAATASHLDEQKTTLLSAMAKSDLISHLDREENMVGEAAPVALVE